MIGENELEILQKKKNPPTTTTEMNEKVRETSKCYTRANE